MKEGKLRMIRYLLSNKNRLIKLRNVPEAETSNSNIGTPRWDHLSPVLFTICLENIRKLKEPSQTANDGLELAYVNFGSSTTFNDVSENQKHKVL